MQRCYIQFKRLILNLLSPSNCLIYQHTDVIIKGIDLDIIPGGAFKAHRPEFCAWFNKLVFAAFYPYPYRHIEVFRISNPATIQLAVHKHKFQYRQMCSF